MDIAKNIREYVRFKDLKAVIIASRMWRRIVWNKFTDVWEELLADYSSTPEQWGKTFLRNVNKRIPGYMASHSRRQ
jgi:hypothetical protein